MLTTERLALYPLPPEELEQALADLPGLERKLGVCYRATELEGVFREIVVGQAAVTRMDPSRYVWHSFWWLIRKSDRVVVGAADFKDVPDGEGQVEIGYGLGAAFEGQGYMTEAVSALCDWALEQPGVRRILAETEADGSASQRILKRCGFREFSRGETVWWYR